MVVQNPVYTLETIQFYRMFVLNYYVVCIFNDTIRAQKKIELLL